VRYLVTKPLPITDSELLAEEPADIRDLVERYSREGSARLAAIREWFGDVEDADPLSPWLEGDAALRLSFARLHAEAEQ